MGQPDYYAVLGVTPGSDAVVIRAVYKALMLKFHPDRNPGPEGERRARAINEAFTVLGDPRRRAAYDARRAADARARAAAAGRRGRAYVPPPPLRPAPPRPPVRAPGGLPALGMPAWATPKRAAAVGGTISLAVAVHLATVAFAPAGLFVSMPVRANTVAATRSAPGYAQSPDEVALALVPPPDVAFDDVEQGAADFVGAFRKGGMKAARIDSQRCHGDVDRTPSWRAADRCAAFDLAANAYDDAVAESNGVGSDGYFRFASHNPTGLYRRLSADELQLEMRGTRILRAALPALQDAMWPGGRDHRAATREAKVRDPAADRSADARQSARVSRP